MMIGKKVVINPGTVFAYIISNNKNTMVNLKQENRELLLKDLCARLPYGVIVYFDGWNPEKLTDIDLHTMVVNGMGGLPKPYLRPMSSMTEEERKEYEATCPDWNETLETYDWLNAHHFDYRDLIPMGLALEATEGMYKL